MDRTACTEPQCLYKGALYLYLFFASLRKAIYSFVMSVRLSVWNNSVPNGRILMKFDIRVFFRKSAEKIQVALKSDKKGGTLHAIQYKFFIMSRSFLLSIKKHFRQKFVEEIKTHILCSVAFFFENRAVYEII